MDPLMPWRALEPSATDGEQAATAETDRESGGLRLVPGRSLAIVLGLLLVLASAGVVVLAQARGPAPVVVAPSAGSAAASTNPDLLVVEVAGAVRHPGVYRLPSGSRVADAVKAAGGFSQDVDASQAEMQLNLAARLQDGQVVRLPRRGTGATAPASPTGAGGASSDGLLDLNSASAEQLDGLPGVGPATAAKIIAAREEQRFKSVDDLVARKIVGAAALAKFRALVTVR